MDVDGEPITALTADLSALPPGATFTADPGDTTGTLSWTPAYDDSGAYTVTFTAANALSATATTAITVSNVDRAPILAAPPAVAVAEASLLSIRVHAADPDGDAITSLGADLSGLPAGAAFTADPGDTTGTLSWTPAYDDSGSYTVAFTAANALSATATTTITVSKPFEKP